MFKAGERLVVHPEVIEHPLLGDAHVIAYAGEPITAMSAIDWERPTRIPTVAEPRKLPPGTGSLLLNDIAVRAEAAGVQTLRYAGPYPTPALFRSLLRSFRTTATEAEFSHDVLARAVRLARDEVPVDFTPAPFKRVTTFGGYVDMRDGNIDRALVDNVLFDVDGVPGSLARLVGLSAELKFGDFTWVKVAELDRQGRAIDGPHPVPALESDVVGKTFPSELCAQFADLVADAVPSVLASDARGLVLASEIKWADLGVHAARREVNGFAVHAGFWTILAPHGMGPFALAVADVLANVVMMTILDELAR